MSVIRLDNLAKSYGTVKALDGLTAELPGGAMGLLGPNGAGKTTLLKTLLGLLHADEGRAEVLGLDTARSPLDLRRRVGYMPETDCWIPGMKGVRFVAYAGRLAGMPARDALPRAHEVLSYVGLGEARYRMVGEYSQGMRQRLRLAQALVHDPELLFLDEPTSGLDPGGRREMLGLIEDLSRDHGKHLVLSSHLLPDVEEVCSFVVVLSEGRIAARGRVEDLTARQEGRYEARLKGDVGAVLGALRDEGIEARAVDADHLAVDLAEGTLPLFRAVSGAGAQVRELAEVTSTLEDAFLSALHPGDPGAGETR